MSGGPHPHRWVVAGPGDVAARAGARAAASSRGPDTLIAVDPAERRLPDAALQAALQTVLVDEHRLDRLELVLVFAAEFATAHTQRLVSRVEDPRVRLRPRDSTDMETSESLRWTFDALDQGTPRAVLIIASEWDPDLAATLTDHLEHALLVRYRTWGDDPRDTDVEVALVGGGPRPASVPGSVVVSGMGLLTAYGSGVEALVDGLEAGADPLPDLPVGSQTRPVPAPGQASGWLADALEQALDDAGWTAAQPPGLVLAAQAVRPAGADPTNPIWAPGPVRAAGHTWSRPLVVSHACASALFALDLAVRLVRCGAQRAVLVAGVSACTPCMVDSLGVVRALGSSPSRPFDLDRDGITIGEGAGAVLVEPFATARERGSRTCVELAAVVATVRGRSAAASDSDAVAACLGQALGEARASGVDYVHAHATGTPQGDQAELEALGQVVSRLRDDPVPVSSHKGALGHLLHASALPGLAVGIEAVRRGRAPGNVNLRRPLAHEAVVVLPPGATSLGAAADRTVLVDAFGFGGNNATALLRTAPAGTTTEQGRARRRRRTSSGSD